MRKVIKHDRVVPVRNHKNKKGGRGVKKIELRENFKMVAHNCRCHFHRLRNAQHLWWRPMLSRMVNKLRATWKFFTFNEDNPKHSIIDSADVLKAIAVALPLLIVFGACSTVTIMYLVKDIFLMSAITLFAYPIIYGMATLELLHLIYDR